MTKLVPYILVFLFYNGVAYSQVSKPLQLIPVTEDNGLSDNQINCVLKDGQGMVWIGTEDGLNVMDGSSIKVFKHKDGEAATLSGNAVKVLKEDSKGNIWVGTNYGLSCYKKKDGIFKNYYFKQSPYGGATNIVSGIAVDSNEIWVSTYGGFFHIDLHSQNCKLLLFGAMESALGKVACNKITQLLRDASGMIWLCTYEGLWSYDPDKNVFQKRVSPANDHEYDPLNLSAYDTGDNIWIGTWNNGLKLYNKRSSTVLTYPNNKLNITCVTGIKQPNAPFLLWLNGSLETFNPVSKTFLSYEKSAGNAPHINNIYQSADGWVWLCSNSGLYIYNPARQTFKNTVFDHDLTSQSIVFANSDTTFLIGAGGADILKAHDSNSKVIANYHDLLFKNFNGNWNGAALDLLIESKRSWWLATSEGIAHLNPEANSSKWFQHDQKDSTSLPKNFITHIYKDSKNVLWIFPWRAGVWQMNTVTGKCKRIIDGITTTAGLVKKLVVTDAAEDNLGNLWMADIDEGIIYYDRGRGVFSKPFVNIIGAGSRTFRIYKQGEYFYSIANTTLLKWKDKNHYSTLHFPVEMEKAVYDFASDKQGNWWYLTHNGLVYFNERKNIFKRFTTSDGLYSNDLSASIFCKPDGEMIIGGNDYFTTFFPQQIIASADVVPKLLLTKFIASGNNLEIDHKKATELAYNNNNIVINWSLPDYSSPFKNQYYCKMQGIDSDWRYTGNRGEVQYASLSPGNYTILLKAATANGDNPRENLKINFKIHQPFWKTTWFIVIVLLVLGTILYFIISRRINSIKAKAAVQQQLSELEMKALRAQMNPHFIFNSLNSIQECIVMNNTSAAYEYLSKFSKLVRRILENSGKLYVSLKEEMELLKWYVGLEQLRFKEPVQFTITSDVDINEDDLMIPSMIVQPYVENALWHGLARKEGEKILTIQFQRKEEGLECIIEDNGVGRQTNSHFANSSSKKSMGMMITKERLELFNKKARIETIDLLNENGAAMGTRIVIYLPAE